MTKAERANQRNAVLAGFLGWTLDAFDFFILTLVIDDVAQVVRPHATGHRADAHADAGDAADRRRRLRHHGRPLRPPAAADAQRRLLRGRFRCCRASRPATRCSSCCACCSASAWAASGASARRSRSSRRRRGCAACCRACCRRATRSATCSRRSRSALSIRVFNALYPGNGWRVMFFLGGLPALLSLFIRAKVKESEAWHEHRTDWATYRRSLLAALAALRLPRAADDDDELHVARHAGHVSDAAAARSATRTTRIADITMLSMIGAILGGLVFGYYSDQAGPPPRDDDGDRLRARRRAVLDCGTQPVAASWSACS